MANASLATSVLHRLIETGETVINLVYGEIMGSWPGMTIVTLYVVIAGYLIIMGHGGAKSKEWAMSALLLTVLGGVVSSDGAYTEWVAGPIYDMAFKLSSVGAQALEGGSAKTMFDGMEETIGRMMAIVDNVDVPGNFLTNAWLYIKIATAMIILVALSLGLYFAALALFCIAFFSLFMMLLVGGPCLWLASFKETRHITWAWLRATANYSMWIFYLGLVVAVGMTFLHLAADDLGSWDVARDGVFTEAVGGSMVLSALTIYMLLKASDWAAAITGGTSTNTGIIGAMGSMAGGALGGAANALGGAAGGAAKWGGGVLANKTAPGAAAYRAFSAMRGLGQTK